MLYIRLFSDSSQTHFLTHTSPLYHHEIQTRRRDVFTSEPPTTGTRVCHPSLRLPGLVQHPRRQGQHCPLQQSVWLVSRRHKRDHGSHGYRSQLGQDGNDGDQKQNSAERAHTDHSAVYVFESGFLVGLKRLHHCQARYTPLISSSM